MNRLAELLSTEASADLRYESTPLDPEGVDWVPLGVGGPCFEVSYARQHADRFRIQWWGKRTPRRPGRLYFTNQDAATECAQLLEQAHAADKTFRAMLLAGIRDKDRPSDLGQLVAAAAAPGPHAGPDHQQQQAAVGPAAVGLAAMAAAAVVAPPGAAALGAQQQNGPVGFAHLGPPAALPAPASLAHMTAGLTSMHLANTAAAAAAAAGPSGHRPMPPAPQVPPPAAGSSQAPRPPAGAAASGIRRGFLGPGPQQQQQQPPMAGRQQGHDRDVQKGAAVAGEGAGAGGGMQQSAGQHALAAAQQRLLPAVQAAAPVGCSTRLAALPSPLVAVPQQHQQQQSAGPAQQQQLQGPGAGPGQVAWPVQRGPAVLLFRSLPPGFYPVVDKASKRPVGSGGFAEVFACSVRWVADGSELLVPAGLRLSSSQLLPRWVIIKKMRCDLNQVDMQRCQGWFDVVMGPYLRGVVPVLGAWGYSRGGQPVELFYAMPSMGPAFCSLADAFLPKSLTRQVPAAPGVETDMCASRVFIRDMWRGSRVVPWPRQGLPFGMVLVLVLKMLEVALLLHDQGAVHADIKSANWVLDPRPLAASAQRLLEAAAAAGALGGQAGYELLTAAFQDLMQVAATLEMVTCDRDSAYVEDANGEMQSCIPVHGDESYWPPEVDQAHRAGDKRTAVKRAATFPAMGFGIGRTGLRLLLRCCQEFFSRHLSSADKVSPTDADLEQLLSAMGVPWELAQLLIWLLQQDPAKRPTPDDIRKLLRRLAAFFLPKTFEEQLKPERLANNQPCSTHGALLAEYGSCRPEQLPVSLCFGGAEVTAADAAPGEAPAVPAQLLLVAQPQQQQQQKQDVDQEPDGSQPQAEWPPQRSPAVLVIRRLPPGVTPVVVQGSMQRLGNGSSKVDVSAASSKAGTFICDIDWRSDGSELLVPDRSKQRLPPRVVLKVFDCSDQNQEQLHDFLAQFDSAMGRHLRKVVPVLGAWGYSVGGRIMELCYAMPYLAPPYCTLEDAFLSNLLSGRAADALEGGEGCCGSKVWIPGPGPGISQEVPWLKQGLPFAAVVVLTREMAAVALALNGEGLVHCNLDETTILLDPTPLAGLVQQLLAAGDEMRAAGRGSLDAEMAQGHALQDSEEEWRQVADQLRMLVIARDRIQCAQESQQEEQGCFFDFVNAYEYQAPEVRALAADPAAAALKAATWPAMMFAIGRMGAQVVLRCLRKYFSHHLTLPGPWKQLCKALDVPKMLGGGLAQLMHEDPAQRPTPEVLRTMVLFNRDFFTKAFYEDTLTLLDDCPGSFGSHMLQYACCRPECVKRGLGINGAVVPPASNTAGTAAAAAAGAGCGKRPADSTLDAAAKRAKGVEEGAAADS